MSKLKELSLYFIADPNVTEDHDGALATEMRIIKDHILIRDVDDLIRRVIHECNTRGGRVKNMVIAGHGNKWTYRIGKSLIGIGSPELPRLAVLRGFFSPNAVVLINACECGQNDELIKQTAGILGVTVIAYTGETDVYHWWVFKGVVPRGTKVICTAGGCRKTTAWIEYQQAFEKGPGEPPAWASREK
jgi:hypothetical protein